MPPTLTPQSNARPDAAGPPGRTGEPRSLTLYADRRGALREVVLEPAAAGSALVVDRDAVTGGDRRLVAHLAAKEPDGNAELICGLFVRDARVGRGGCRPVAATDPLTEPPADSGHEQPPAGATPRDEHGFTYRLVAVATGTSIPELRWRRSAPGAKGRAADTVSVRDAVGAVQRYEPIRSLTARALALHAGTAGLSTVALRCELARLQRSPIVLNRRLREVALATIERDGLSMSEIAIRCGRVKRDSRGKQSGETSWLARRLGLLPEGGHSLPTPWIHTEVLALIARTGLGVSPNEVEEP